MSHNRNKAQLKASRQTLIAALIDVAVNAATARSATPTSKCRS